MGVRNVLKKGLSWGFSPSRWMGVEHVKSQSQVCKELAKDLLPKETKLAKDEQVASLSGEERDKRKKLSLYLIFVYGALACLALVYAFYLWTAKSFVLAGFVGVTISLLLGSYGLRELVLYTQLRLKKNKLTLKEVYHVIIKGFSK